MLTQWPESSHRQGHRTVDTLAGHFSQRHNFILNDRIFCRVVHWQLTTIDNGKAHSLWLPCSVVRLNNFLSLFIWGHFGARTFFTPSVCFPNNLLTYFDKVYPLSVCQPIPSKVDFFLSDTHWCYYLFQVCINLLMHVDVRANKFMILFGDLSLFWHLINSLNTHLTNLFLPRARFINIIIQLLFTIYLFILKYTNIISIKFESWPLCFDHPIFVMLRFA